MTKGSNGYDSKTIATAVQYTTAAGRLEIYSKEFFKQKR
jgi:hypothetical protein